MSSSPVELDNLDEPTQSPPRRSRRSQSTGRKAGVAMDYRLADVAALDEDLRAAAENPRDLGRPRHVTDNRHQRAPAQHERLSGTWLV
jgi:hypothetical protein